MNFPPSTAEEVTTLSSEVAGLTGVTTAQDLGTHDVRRFNSFYFSVFGIMVGANDDPVYVHLSWFTGESLPNSEVVYEENHSFFLRSSKFFYENAFVQGVMHGPYMSVELGPLNGTVNSFRWQLLGSTRQLPNQYLGNDDDTLTNLPDVGDDGFVVDSDPVALAAAATRTYPFRHSMGPMEAYIINGAGTLTYLVEVNRDGIWRSSGISGTVAANTTVKVSFFKTKQATRLSVTNTAGVSSNVSAKVYRSFTTY